MVALQKVNREDLKLHEHRLSPRARRGGQRRGRLVPALSSGVKKFGPQLQTKAAILGGLGTRTAALGQEATAEA